MTIKKIKLPEQCYPSGDRRSSAAYNFVPLPEAVIPGAELPDHGEFVTGLLSGYFDVRLTTKTPLYIRSSFTLDEFHRQEDSNQGNLPFSERVRNKPNFFYIDQVTKEPVIPGSSIRGMLRNIVEIISFAKVQWVSEKNLFFRTVDPSSIGKHYRERMVGNKEHGNKIETGFLIKKGREYIIKKCEMARVHRDKIASFDNIEAELYNGKGPSAVPKWQGHRFQYMPVWVRHNGLVVQEIQMVEKIGLQKGLLVITGPAPRKKKEFVFFPPNESGEEITIPEWMMERFHDDDQITKWQEKAFPRNRPNNNYRDRDGMVGREPERPGDPVFFLREEGKLSFFGRAQMFRLPYKLTPLDFVPKELRDPETVDMAEALFGFIQPDEAKKKYPQGDKRRSYSSRIRFTDAVLVEGQTGIFQDADTPKILSTPKPTSFQHYLVQTRDIKDKLHHYGTHPGKETVIRGNKIYRHQGGMPQWRSEEAVPGNSTQHTRIRPVSPEISFRFRVDFENLTKVELGALAWALQPNGDEGKTYYHKLGMGKTLGLGAIQLQASLRLIDRTARYRSLLSGDDWQSGESNGDIDKLIGEFEPFIINQISPGVHHFSEIPRIGALLSLMEWSDEPVADARTLSLDEFKPRKVLPPAFEEKRDVVRPVQPNIKTPPSEVFEPKQSPTQPHRRQAPPPPKPLLSMSDLIEITSKQREKEQIEQKSIIGIISGPVSNKGKAKVDTELGEITCGKIPNYPVLEIGRKIKLKISVKDGKPVGDGTYESKV